MKNPFELPPTDRTTHAAALAVLAAEVAVLTPAAVAGWDLSALLGAAVVALAVTLGLVALVSSAKPHHVLFTSATIVVNIGVDVALVVYKHVRGGLR